VLVQRCKLGAQPSGAAGIAGLMSGRVAPKAASTVVWVISGGNIGLTSGSGCCEELAAWPRCSPVFARVVVRGRHAEGCSRERCAYPCCSPAVQPWTVGSYGD
jgi:hypothetical protein